MPSSLDVHKSAFAFSFAFVQDYIVHFHDIQKRFRRTSVGYAHFSNISASRREIQDAFLPFPSD
jgi:hypothetical protein